MTSSEQIYIEFDKMGYIDELILKLQKLYSQNIVDKNFFDKSLELLNQEKIDILSNNIKAERNFYISSIEKVDNFKDLEIINNIIFDKLKYSVENKSFLIENLNDRFEEMMYNQDLLQEFEVNGDLTNFFHNEKCLLNDENKNKIYNFISNNREDVYDYTLDIQNLSPEEKQKYFEIEKQGIKMKMIEASNFSNLNTLYSKIYSDLKDDKLKIFLKDEFTNTFKKLFKSSYIYFILEDFNKNYGKMNLEDICIEKDRLYLKNSIYEYYIDENLIKKQKIRYFDQGELNSLIKIIKNTYNCFTQEFIENILQNIIKLPEYKMTLEERMEEIKKIITKILNKDENRFFRSTISIDSDVKFSEKLLKCNRFYQNKFKEENTILIFDNTLFKTCKKGFIITDKNFYFKNEEDKIEFISIDEINEIELKEDKIYLNDKFVYCDIVQNNYRQKFKDTILIIIYLIQNVKDESKNLDELIEEVLSIEY